MKWVNQKCLNIKDFISFILKQFLSLDVKKDLRIKLTISIKLFLHTSKISNPFKTLYVYKLYKYYL